MRRKIFIRQKTGKCYFCESRVEPDWKDLENLGKFVSERGKIFPKLRSGICSKHQRRLSQAIKRARYLGLLSYTTQVR